MFDAEKRFNYSSCRRNIKQKIGNNYPTVLDSQGITKRCDVQLTRCGTCVQDYDIYLQAFALIYVLPEEEWLSENIDRLLTDGDELFRGSCEKNGAHGTIQETDSSIKRSFKLEGLNFTLELKSPLKEQKLQHIISNLTPVFEEFFGSAHYCLFQYSTVNLLIWQRNTNFYVMNVKQRRVDTTKSFQNGGTILVRLPALNNVIHIIRNLSGINDCDEFTIRELAVIRLVTPDGRCFFRNSNQPSMEYSIINKNYAYLRSNLHLSLNPAELLRNGSSLIVGVIGILAANIEHPATWVTKTLDSIICLGVELYRNRWCENCLESLPIDLETFPTQVRLGQFMVKIKLLPKMCRGQWRGGNVLKGKNFAFEISKILKNNGNALFQINCQLYTLWCKDDSYYLLDPYRHQVMTSSQTNENGGSICAKWATLRMFRDLANMLNVFHKLLKESNQHSTFVIHAVAIQHISESTQENAGNETPNSKIRFPQIIKNYEKLLAGDSDYEPDVVSDLEDLKDVESFTIVKSRILRPAKAKHDIHNQISQADGQKSPDAKSKQKTIKDTEYIKDNKTTEKLNSLRRKVLPTNVHNPTKNKIATTKKKFNHRLATNCNLPPTMKPNDLYKLSQIDAKMCARYRNIEIDHLNFGSCRRCPAGQSESTQKLNTVSQMSFHTAPIIDKSMDLLSPEIKYPIYSKYPANLAVAGSESGTMESLNRLLDVAFKVSNRVLTMTPWGNYVVFRCRKSNTQLFYIFDGCTCNIDRFRHLDLRKGTAGLLAFQSQSQVVCFMIDSRESKALTLVRSRLEQPCSGT